MACRVVLSFALTCFLLEIWSCSARELYTNTWVVYSDNGKEYVDEIARKRGFFNHGQQGGLEGYYLLEHKRLGKRTRRSLVRHSENFLSEPHIKYAQQQKILRRQKRNYKDPYYPDQWYLHNTGQTPGPSKLDINVLPVWKKNITGKNVVVTILDDGIEYTHPDLKDNYEASASWDFNSRDSDPMPRYSADNVNKHGTRCAGEVAAKSKNNVCGVGVAYNARIGGVRMLDGDVTDIIEGGSLSLKTNFIDIYSSSWGPDDDGRTVDGPGPMAKKAFRDGIRKGRKGLGSIFVWATGNGGRYNDYCNCDGYITSIFTISIGAVNDKGKSPWYAEPCPSTLAVTYSSGQARGPDLKIVTTDLYNKCTKEHTGTSAAAPLAAGIFALVLEANPKLSWRDLQHLIVNTSKKNDPEDPEWQKNSAGHHVNNKYGFGVLDTAALVDLATHPKWHTTKEQHVCRELGDIGDRTIPRKGTFTSSLYSNACNTKANCVTKLEHVRVYVTLSHPRRGAISITLISPSGTKSQLLQRRDNDHSSDGFQNWPFMTTFSWGENPKGIWTIKVTDHADFQGLFKRWSLRLYGSCVERNRNITAIEKQSCQKNCKKHCPLTFAEVCTNCSQYCHCETGECVRFCNEEDEIDEKTKHCLPPNTITAVEREMCQKNCKRRCPFSQFCHCKTGRCSKFCDHDYKVDEKARYCTPLNGHGDGPETDDDEDTGELSTFVKWLIIFSLLAILLATILIMYLFKASGKVCWARPAMDKNSVQRNVSYAPVSLNNHEAIKMNLPDQRSLVL